VVKDCPADLAELVARLLAKAPGDRPPSASSVERILYEILQGQSVAWPSKGDEPSASDVSTAEYRTTNLTDRLYAESPAARVTAKRVAVIFGTIAVLIVLLVLASHFRP
jgi:hypothetical protein